MTTRGASYRRRALARTCSLWLALGITVQLSVHLVVWARAAEARPGGGQTYSSPSRSSYSPSSSSYSSYSSSRSSYSSSGSSAGSGEMTWVDIFFGVAMAAVAGGSMLIGAFTGIRDIIRDERESRRLTRQLEATRTPLVVKPAPTGWSVRPRRPRSRRPRLLECDPNFSLIVFEDLVFRLYAAAYQRAGLGGDLDGLAPYLAPEVRLQLGHDLAEHGHASGVAIGSLSAGKVDIDDARQTITVDIEANVSFVARNSPATWYLVERWTFARSPGTVTRPPEAVMQLGCPACGAPFKSSDDRRCAHCDTVVADGRFEWQVVRREVREREDLPPTLTRSIVEVGTDAPTIVHSGLPGQLQALAGDAPGGVDAVLAAIRGRTSEIFRVLNAGWDARDLATLRPCLSDALFDAMRYWLAAYAARGLHNRVEQASVTAIEPARVRRDAYFDAITLRVHARCLDYTLDGDGDLISGSRREPRRYSEYWTLIRGRHPGERRGGAGQCPSCAAPLHLTMAGHCEHCRSHLTLGEFDWVLSKIEQDEAYRG